MNDHDQNSARARLIRGNRRARGFNRERANAASFDNAEVPRWLMLSAIGAVACALIAIYFMFFAGGNDTNDVLLTSAPDLAVGTCFDADQDFWLDSIVTRNCFEPHVGEVTGIVDVGDQFLAYPLLDELRRVADRNCAAELTSRYLVSSAARITVASSLPTAADWAAGNTMVLCSVKAADGSLLRAPVEFTAVEE